MSPVSSPVTAVVSSGGTASAASVVLTTKATGADQNGAITLSLVTTKVTAAAASLSGGAGATYDTGTVTANQTGTADNGLPVTLSSATDEPKFFSSASFSGTSGTLSGGVDATYTSAPVYNYTISPSGGASGYAANGNVLSYTDLMDGGWTLNYDNVNRVSSAVANAGPWTNLTLTWTYDSFGNRETQTPSGQHVMAPVPEPPTFTYTSQNRIVNYVNVDGYDNAGNVTYDLVNHYLYDPEGRLCAVEYPSGQGTEYMLYLYDGEGRRVAKVSNPTFSCTPGTGSTLLETYLLGPSGEHITELGQAGIFLRSNVYANGQLLATYTNNKTYFALNDWLGSKRVVTNYDGTVAQMCMNLPFGDELICSANDLSEHHFTGQIHDQESGNDYFNARYYSNGTGRFMSPDPSGLLYADPTNPQSLNLYGYVLNNPLSFIDPTGQDCVYFNDAGNGVESVDPDNSSQSLNQQASDCGANGGAYLNGTVNPNSVQYNSGTDTFNIQSSDALLQYNSTVTASGPNSFYGSDITNGVIDQLRALLPQSTSGLFTYNDSLSNILDMLKSVGVTPSGIDNKYNQGNHHGTQLRDESTFCNLHMTIAPGSGQNGAPVTGDYHYDTVNPWAFPAPVTTAAHGALDYIPDKARGRSDASSQYVCTPR
jgi:RHS repeat-associated protein